MFIKNNSHNWNSVSLIIRKTKIFILLPAYCFKTIQVHFMSETKIRLSLFGSVSIGIFIVFSFLWVMNINQPESLKDVLNNYVFILCGITCATFFFFFMKFDIFNTEKKLEKDQILVITCAMLAVAQLTFGFANYAYNELNANFETRNKAANVYKHITSQFDARMLSQEIEKAEALASSYTQQNSKQYLQQQKIAEQATQDLKTLVENYQHPYREFDYISLTNSKNIVIASTKASLLHKKTELSPLEYYSFPLNSFSFNLHISKEYKNSLIRSIIAELLTSLAITLFFTIELMLFVLKYWDRKLSPPQYINDKKPCQALEYIRPLAFVFYFSSRMAMSFIPIMAQGFGDSFFGLSSTSLASIPLSVEVLFTTASIFFTTYLIENKGWKVPFVGGLALVSLGSLMSAYSPNIFVFILSRALVGLGYGFCWMTLRNLSLFGRDEKEKSLGFSLLNAGIYAGVNCGAVFGAVLAESLGYTDVFLLATFLTLLCSAFVLKLENQIYVRPLKQEHIKRTLSKEDKVQYLYLSFFVLLLLIPSTIAGSFLAYFLPLYLYDLAYSIADVGRAQLFYGILIIYAGPVFATLRNHVRWTYIYSLIIALAFITFALFGGFIPALMTVFILGLADSFGFVMQNNYFLKFKVLRNFGESASLSLLSFIKKGGEATGPLVFAAAMAYGLHGIFILGVIFLVATLIYILFIGRRVNIQD